MSGPPEPEVMPRILLALSAMNAFTWFCEDVKMSVLYFRLHPSTISASRARPKSMNGGATTLGSNEPVVLLAADGSLFP